VGRQHQGRPLRHRLDVVDEDDPELAKPVDHDLVVDDLVIAVHRRLKDPVHPGERLDGHLHPGTKAPRRSEEHLVHVHGFPG